MGWVALAVVLVLVVAGMAVLARRRRRSGLDAAAGDPHADAAGRRLGHEHGSFNHHNSGGNGASGF